MGESVFCELAPVILKLHRRTSRSWLALSQNGNEAVFNSPYVHINGLYYCAIPADSPALQYMYGIVLIEDEDGGIYLSWICRARELSCKECAYRSACQAFARRCPQEAGCKVIELHPEQGRLSIGNRYESPLSPQHLARALYPADGRLAVMTG